jgi:hypothetical protein
MHAIILIIIIISRVVITIGEDVDCSAIKNIETLICKHSITQLSTEQIQENESVLRNNRNLNDKYMKDQIKGSGTLPSIFIVGAQKGGSSSLFGLMIQHPSLCKGLHKESHYFSPTDIADDYREKGTDFYKLQFINATCDVKKGAKYIDATPILHSHDQVNESVWTRIYNTYNTSILLRDNLKFIALLREPVSRDYSWYQHSIRTELEGGKLFTDIKTMSERSKNDGSDQNMHIMNSYVHQLKKFAAVFKRNQIMVLSSADVFQNTASVMDRIRKFIDVPAHKAFDGKIPHDDHLDKSIKKGKAFVQCIVDHVPQLDCSERDRLGTYYEPYNQELYQFLKNDGVAGKADPNEPPFWPVFDTYKALPCSDNSRKELNEIIKEDKIILSTHC